MTPERRAYAESQGLNPIAVMESFVDYWTATSGAKGRKCDWDATWRTWCRNQYGRAGSKEKPYKAPRTTAEILAEEERERQSAH
jgi:hypothetical protein